MSNVLINGGTALEWSVENPILPANFVGIESDTDKLKTGDGKATWNALMYNEVPMQNRNIACIGDSTAQQNTSVAGGSKSYQTQGPLTQALNLLGWPWEFSVDNNYGVGSTNVRQCIDVQIPLLLADHVKKQFERCFISTGTNDISSTLTTRKKELLELFNILRSNNIIPVYVGIRPRGNDSTVLDYKKQNLAINQWCMMLDKNGIIEYIPVSKVYADTTSIYGNCVTSSSNDQLHPNVAGAIWEGIEIYNYYYPKGILPRINFAVSQLDTFSRANNPNGVCFNAPNPLLLGGTTQPTGISTTGGTWAATDVTITNGQTRRKWGVASVVPSTVHNFIDNVTGTGAFSGDTQPAAGEYVRGYAKIVLTDVVDLRASINIAESNGSTTLTYYDNLTSLTDRLPLGTYTMYLQTEKIPVREWAGSGNQSLTMTCGVSCGASASGSFLIESFEMRVIN